MKVVDIFGQGKQKILNNVKHDLEAELGRIGIQSHHRKCHDRAACHYAFSWLSI